MILTKGKGRGGDKHVAESGGDPGGEREGEAGEAALTLGESELTEVEEVSYEPRRWRVRRYRGTARDDLGEEIRSVVARKKGEPATEEEIIAFARECVAAYRYPRSVIFMEDLSRPRRARSSNASLVEPLPE